MPTTTIITDDVALAARTVAAGGLVAFPTETVFGLGADATDPAAVARIFVAKGRPQDNPLIVHVANIPAIESVAQRVPETARILLDAFAPGPLTVILERGKRIAPAVSAGLNTVAVRIPGLAVTREFLSLTGRPVAAPSANRSGRPSATTWQAVVEDLDGRIEMVLKGAPSLVGLESTVVDCTGSDPVILRLGGVSLEDLRAVVASTTFGGGQVAASPGTRHPHYRPRAEVVVVDGPGSPPSGTAFLGLSGPEDRTGYARFYRYESVDEYASHLFDAFRRCDAEGLVRIECQAVPAVGIGAALMDRLTRAARKAVGDPSA